MKNYILARTNLQGREHVFKTQEGAVYCTGERKEAYLARYSQFGLANVCMRQVRIQSLRLENERNQGRLREFALYGRLAVKGCHLGRKRPLGEEQHHHPVLIPTAALAQS